MKKMILLTLFISSVIAEPSLLPYPESNGILKPTVSTSESLEIVGGWYPVFFHEYSNRKVQEIINSISSGKVKRLIISYDENKSLAMQIRTNIQAKVNFAIQMEHVPLTDSDSTQFNHSQVVITVYTR